MQQHLPQEFIFLLTKILQVVWALQNIRDFAWQNITFSQNNYSIVQLQIITLIKLGGGGGGSNCVVEVVLEVQHEQLLSCCARAHQQVQSRVILALKSVSDNHPPKRRIKVNYREWFHFHNTLHELCTRRCHLKVVC